MRIFLIVVNWNGKDDTISCLNSIARSGIPLSAVIVVDNGSADDSPQVLSERFPGLLLIRNKENLGYAGGNNVGIRHALSLGADAVYLLNNDTEVSDGFLGPVLAAFAENEKIGIVGSKVYFHGRPERVWFGNPALNKLTGRTYDTEYGKTDSEKETMRDVPFISGCAFAARRKTIEKIGLLDERFFCYAEELDLCLRAKESGFRVVLVPDSRVYHKVSASTGGATSGKTMYYRMRNHLLLINKNIPLKSRAVTALRNCLIVLTHVAAIFRRGMRTREAFIYLLQGIRDYFSGKFGEGQILRKP